MTIRRLVLGLMVLVTCAGCSHFEPAAPPPTVRVTRVHSGSLTDVLTFTGTLQARRRASVNSVASGMVEQVGPIEGDFVTQGQPLVWLSSASLRAQLAEQEAAIAVARTKIRQLEAQVAGSQSTVGGNVAQAQASYDQAVIATAAARTQLKSAQSTEKRYEDLYKEKAIAQQQLLQAQLQVKLQQDQLRTALSKQAAAREAITQARQGSHQTAATLAELEGARASVVQSEASAETLRVQIEQTIIRAPITGVVVERKVDPGQSVGGPGKPLLSIVDNNDLDCIITVDQRYSGVLKQGMAALVAVPTKPDTETKAFVRDVIPSSDPTTRTVRVRLRVPNDRKHFMDGLTISGRINLKSYAGVLIPHEALSRDGSRFTIFVVLDDNQVQLREVKIVAEDQTYALSAEGVRNDERVVVNPSELKEGEQVTPVEAQSPAPKR